MSIEKPHILLVEDNPADVGLVQEALEEEQLDCHLDVIRDGMQAIEYLNRLDSEANEPRPDIVLLDLNLPKMSGEEVLKRLRSSPRYGQTKVLILSSSNTPSDRQRAIQLGATGYFPKPSVLAQFMELGPQIRAMLERTT